MSSWRPLSDPAPRREVWILIISLAVWAAVTALFIGLRPEHIFLSSLIVLLFFYNKPTRQILVALLPFAVFGLSYDWMNIVHNYEVNPVDIKGLYDTEKAWFGIPTAAYGVLTPNEFFSIYRSDIVDFLCGCFYLCWVPVPMLFGLWLYFGRQRSVYLHFALVFLLVNFIGFTFYYIHPAAPPWYVAEHGFDFSLDVPGSVAGLARFDDIVGARIFDSIYTRNSNVFAALPSLHSAYMPTALWYSFRARCPWWMRTILAIITVGIWFTAVYTSHHYIIDVAAGIACTALGIALFECVLMRIPAFARFIKGYTNYISD